MAEVVPAWVVPAWEELESWCALVPPFAERVRKVVPVA